MCFLDFIWDMGQKSKMTSYEDLCVNFDWEECIEDDNDHQQTKITPGKEVQTLTFIDTPGC